MPKVTEEKANRLATGSARGRRHRQTASAVPKTSKACVAAAAHRSKTDHMAAMAISISPQPVAVRPWARRTEPALCSPSFAPSALPGPVPSRGEEVLEARLW